MSLDADYLYQLLPAIYRIRDHEQGEPLKALIKVVAEQAELIEENLEQLYDDQFIETCADWAIPYIGELLGVRQLRTVKGVTRSSRPEVAHTIAYRRRKGTAAVLGQLAHDVTGWPSSVVEFFERLATTQYLNHIRPGKGGTVSLRSQLALERLNGPFDPFAHTTDVRRIASGRGRFNIPNIGIFLWRLVAFPLTNLRAHAMDERRYFFNPLGIDTPLFNHPQGIDALVHSARTRSVPEAISRRQMHARLSDYYGNSLRITLNSEEIPVSDIVVCNLEDIAGGEWAHRAPANKVAVDPVLGRLALGEGKTGEVRVSYYYGFSTAMGGGEYGRAFPNLEEAVIHVPDDHGTIAEALATLHGGGIVEITTSDTFEETLHINVDEPGTQILRAADKCRPLLNLAGEFIIEGHTGANIILDGLLMNGAGLRIRGDLNSVTLRHCTLVPGLRPAIDGVPPSAGSGLLIVEAAGVKVMIEGSIVGALQVATTAKVIITNSIIDATHEQLPAYDGISGGPGGALNIKNSTLIGKVNTLQLDASNCIFMSHGVTTADTPVRAERIQEGCVRFCYVPPGSRVPRPFRCQPISENDAPRVRPVFTSLRYGEPGYCQLQHRCAGEIRRGADDEAEMGAFHDLFQAQREDNLRVRLEEYLRFGLETGLFYMN